MTLFHRGRNGLQFLWDIGITPEIRPEEAKHIRALNVGMMLFAANSLLWFVLALLNQRPAIVTFAQISIFLLCLPVFLFHKAGRYTTARIYGFVMFYVQALFIYTLSGKEIIDHYFFFVAIAYAFLVFPRQEKGLMAIIIAGGLIGHLATLLLYRQFEPVYRLGPTAVEQNNQAVLYNLFLTFIVLMMSARYFMNKTENSLVQEREKLREMSAVLKKMFGRYLSTEVMNSLVENPSALELGGERRRVIIMMTDLRGFTALAERLQPEQVVALLNSYFEVMVDVVLKYQGTINQIIGDALLIVFGAPQEMPDQAQRAVACAVEMQNAMEQVNQNNLAQGLPELEMGIGVHESEVIVGNIGSSKRSSYTAIGSGVNLASRIESYTVGGQILISESLRRQLGGLLRIDDKKEVLPKGSENPLMIYEVGGIAGSFPQALKSKDQPQVTLMRPISLHATALKGKGVGKSEVTGVVLRLSKSNAEVKLAERFAPMTNLKMNLLEVEEELKSRDFYGKIMGRSKQEDGTYLIRFTAVPPEVSAFFQAHRALGKA